MILYKEKGCSDLFWHDLTWNQGSFANDTSGKPFTCEVGRAFRTVDRRNPAPPGM